MAIAFLAAAASAAAMDVRLQGDRLTVHARNEPLTGILKRLAQAGVVVKTDSKVEARVTADFESEDTQKALDTLLSPFGYVLIWDVVEGPLGPWPKLGEIQVFLPGQKKAVRPLEVPSGNLELARGPSGGPAFVKDEILLGFKGGVQRDDVIRLLAQIGGTVVASIPELGIYQVRLAPGTNIPALVEQLARNPLVAKAEPNYAVSAPPPAPPGAGGGGEPAGVVKVGPPGDVAAVAVLDTGLMPDSAVSAAVIGRLDALNPDRPLNDALGHGTQMALIAAGAVQPSGGAAAAGEAVPIVAIRAFDDNGMASNFGIMRSLEYALSQGARVVNMSWDTETPSEFLETAVRYAQSKGLIVVAAAGNQPTQKAVYPAAYPGVVAVSALDADNELWESSNSGDFITAAAPGTADLPVGYKGPAGSYAGTSIASAYVARSLALYLAEHPTATSKEATDALKATLTGSGAKTKDPQYGYGKLDAAAVERLLK